MAEQQYIYVAAPAVVASPASYAGYPGYSQNTETAYVQPNYAFQVTEQSSTGAAYAVPSYQYEVQPATHYAAASAGVAVSGATSQQQVLAEYPVAAVSGHQLYSNQVTSHVGGASSIYSHQLASQQAVTGYGQQTAEQQQQAASYNHMPAASLQQATAGAASYTQQGVLQQQQYTVTYPPHTSMPQQQQQQVQQYALQQQQQQPVAGQQQVLQTPPYATQQVAYAQQAIVPGQVANPLYQQQQQQQTAYLQQPQQMTLPQSQPHQQHLYGQQQQQPQQQQPQHSLMQTQAHQQQQQQQQQLMYPGHSNQQQQQAVRPLTFPGQNMPGSNNTMKLGQQRNQLQQFGNFPAGGMAAPSMPVTRGPPPSMPTTRAPSPSSMMGGDVEVQKFPDTIFIQGLPDDTTEDMLVQHFSTFGKLKVDSRTGKPRVSMVKDKVTGRPRGEATIGYRDVQSANNAIKSFNNKEFQGRKVRIEVASRKLHTPGQQAPPPMQAAKRNRPGEDTQDWVCSNAMCNNQNFSWRTECNRCRAPRSANPQLKSPLGMRLGGGGSGGNGSGGGGGGGSNPMISMPPSNNNNNHPPPHHPFNNHNNPLVRPPLLGNGILPGSGMHHAHNGRPMLNHHLHHQQHHHQQQHHHHAMNNMLGMRAPNLPGQSMRGRLGMTPINAGMAALNALNGGPIRPAIRGRMDRRMGRPY